MSSSTSVEINHEALNELLGKALVEVGGAWNASLVLLGEELGLYKALAAHGPMTSAQLAAQTGTDARYVREWLSAQAASGFVSYQPEHDRFLMTPEQAMAFADADSPVYLPGAFQVPLAAGRSRREIASRFRNGSGFGWHEHDRSVEQARARAAAAGAGDRVRFEVAPARSFPGTGYDLVTFFDCLHDMGDPVGAARHVRESLAPDGTWMIVEPFAGDSLAENLNPVGRLYYAASTMVCTPASKAQEVGLALGAQAGEKRLTEVVREAGFTRVRRAAETPFNIVLEARP